MPEKDGSEDKKSNKSVVNKKQKQFMNQEEQLDLSSVAKSFGGQIVGEPVELNEALPLAAAIPYLMGAGIIGTGAVGYDSYQKQRGKPGILPDLSGVVKGVGDTYNKVKNVFATANTQQQRNKYKKKTVVRNQPFSWGTFKKDELDNNNKNKNKNKNRNKTLRDTGIAGATGTAIGTLIGTQTKGRGGGFRLGGLPGTAHNVGRRTNPQ